MAYIYDDSQTYTGEIVNFTSTDKAKITSVSVPLTPTQDLHGYANPWPGGGGVNKAGPMQKGTFQESKAAGTAYENMKSANDYRLRSIDLIPTNGQQVTVSWSDYAKYAVCFTYYDSDGLYLGEYSGFQSWRFSATTINNASVYYIACAVKRTDSALMTSADIDSLHLQVELGSTATSWTPYENICPISGLTGLSVYRTGKNLYDKSKAIVTGPRYLILGSPSSSAMADGSFVLPAGKYTVSASEEMNVITVSNSASGIKTVYNKTEATFTISELTPIKIQLTKTSATTGYWDGVSVQLELGSTATTYEPYNGNTYSVDWSTQAGTVYHGTVDPVAGQLTVDKVGLDLGSVSWTKYGSTANYDRYITSGIDSLAKNSSSVLCSIFRPRIGSETIVANMAWIASGNSKTSATTEVGAYASASAFKTAMSGQQLVYELATPVTYQLTPKQIAALTENYVWVSNGASITVTVSDVLHDFQGWLLKVGSGMTLVPTEMIKAETYKVSPNQRMEETAERDSTGVLWRETVPNMPPKIEFNTPAAYDTDVNALNAIFRAAYSNEQERKLTVAFYDPEENVYKSWECYMPNIDFPIRTIDIDAKTIFYDEIRYAFIGY